MSAQLVEHHYSSGRRFYTVKCDDCLVVLNSGHHYHEYLTVHAERLADEHNAQHHTSN